METLALKSLLNFRDASGPLATGAHGYGTGDGKPMARGRVFRSDNATALEEPDVRALAALGIARAFDLRSASERRRVPSIFSTLDASRGAETVTVFDDLTSFNEGELAVKLLTTLVRRADVSGLMAVYYRQLPGVFAKPLTTIFNHLLESVEPVVVHCRGGKDRTGFAIAMLHRAIGVSADDALGDYLLSAGLFHPGPEEEAMLDGIARRTGVRLQAETLAPMMSVSADFLAASYEAIDKQYLGLDAYLESCGLTDARRAMLAERLTAAVPA